MILVRGGSVFCVLAGHINLRRGTHGGPGNIGGQHSGEKDQDEPERTHVLLGNKKNWICRDRKSESQREY